MSRCWVTTETRTEVLGRGCVEGGVGSGVARSAWVSRSGACGARGVFEAVGGRAAKEPGWVGRGSVRARRGSGVVEGGAGVRREAGTRGEHEVGPGEG